MQLLLLDRAIIHKRFRLSSLHTYSITKSSSSLLREVAGERKRKVQNSGFNKSSQIIQCSSMKQDEEMTEQVSRCERARAPRKHTHTHTKQAISVNSWRKLWILINDLLP